jgi:Arc/MetJ-type ribon-helix-helix transcriptional regulator
MPAMKIVTINLPERYLDAIQTLQNMGKFPSRSEAIRNALYDLLKDEIIFHKDLDPSNFQELAEAAEGKQ